MLRLMLFPFPFFFSTRPSCTRASLPSFSLAYYAGHISSSSHAPLADKPPCNLPVKHGGCLIVSDKFHKWERKQCVSIRD